MDYEKKYNEALERAKAYHRNELAGSRKEMMEYIFPELAESEDERMMREFNDWLCEEIECRTNDLRDEKDRRTLNMLCYILTKVKDWLEKQKESLHTSETCKENADSFTDEDERIRKWIIEELESTRDAMSGKNPYSDDPDIVARLKRLDEAIDYLEKQKEPENTSASTMAPSCWEVEQKEQKPDTEQQVTKEQLHDLNEAIKGLRMDGCERIADSLHSLYDILTKAQKPAEWSEEDEDRIRQIERIAQQAGCTQKLQEEIHDWLKSLRPSWKPSYEQMEALRRAVNKLANTDVADSVRLSIMYDNLKKL